MVEKQLITASWSNSQGKWHVSAGKDSLGFIDKIEAPEIPLKVTTVDFFGKGFGQVFFESGRCKVSEKNGKKILTCGKGGE